VGRIWDGVLTDREQIVIEKRGHGKSRGLGDKPCLMVIDAQYNYAGEDKSLIEQQDQWPAGRGEEAWIGVRRIEKLIESARAKGIPIIYTRQVQRHTLVFDGLA